MIDIEQAIHFIKSGKIERAFEILKISKIQIEFTKLTSFCYGQQRVTVIRKLLAKS